MNDPDPHTAELPVTEHPQQAHLAFDVEDLAGHPFCLVQPE